MRNGSCLGALELWWCASRHGTAERTPRSVPPSYAPPNGQSSFRVVDACSLGNDPPMRSC